MIFLKKNVILITFKNVSSEKAESELFQFHLDYVAYITPLAFNFLSLSTVLSYLHNFSKNNREISTIMDLETICNLKKPL